jgi:hypothetical protein
MLIVLLFAVAVDAHGSVDVIVHVTASPVTSELVVNVEPPVVGVAVNVTDEPVQLGLDPAVTAIVTVGAINAVTTKFTSLELVQVPLVAVQRNTYVPTALKPVTVDVGDVGVVMVGTAGPLTFDHIPEPTVIVLPARVAVLKHEL